MKKIIIYLFLFTQISCVGFSRKMFNDNIKKINNKNFVLVNGKYENFPYQRLCCNNFSENLTQKNSCLKDYVIRETDKYFPDCLKELSTEIKIIKENEKYFLVLNYIDLNNENQQYKIEGSFTNGFFKLKNYSFKADGVPYIFGGANISQSRIGLDLDNNLILQTFTDNEGAFLLIFWAGHSGDYALKFRNIKDNKKEE